MHPKDWIRPHPPREFEARSLELFRYQYRHNAVYRRFCDLLGRTPGQVTHLEQIPFLPVEMFKRHRVVSAPPPYDAEFLSSGTTGTTPSVHRVKDIAWYERSLTEGFKYFYGAPQDYVILALLPSYLERKGSSLVYMARRLMQLGGKPESGFYLNDFEALRDQLLRLEARGQKTLLLGVSFALMDFAERFPMRLHHTIVMETGGMKGRRREPVREELHGYLQQRLGVPAIHSEYGMTELLSQAYSKGHGKFRTPPWMKVLIRDPEDPLDYLPAGRTGGINIIDLANVHSCAFLSVQDLGRMHPDGSFEVLGRFDNSDIRGCNLLVVG